MSIVVSPLLVAMTVDDSGALGVCVVITNCVDITPENTDGPTLDAASGAPLEVATGAYLPHRERDVGSSFPMRMGPQLRIPRPDREID